MESLFHTKCHKIIDHQQVEGHVVDVVSIQINMASVVFIELEELKILMFAINGDQDILKDNGTYNFK
tara:strand:+ start:154 stop:354 length:201 start_codon:yes stop_codon:yes gene_type:complete